VSLYNSFIFRFYHIILWFYYIILEFCYAMIKINYASWRPLKTNIICSSPWKLINRPLHRGSKFNSYFTLYLLYILYLCSHWLEYRIIFCKWNLYFPLSRSIKLTRIWSDNHLKIHQTVFRREQHKTSLTNTKLIFFSYINSNSLKHNIVNRQNSIEC